MYSTNEIIYYDFGNFRLDVTQERLLKDGKPLTLTHKAFSTLLILVKNAGKIVEKEDIISQIWCDSFVEESNLSQYIYVLRKLLGTDPSGNPYIETITKRGFRFTAEVVEIRAEKESDAEVLNADIIDDKQFRGEQSPDGNGFAHVSMPSEAPTPNGNSPVQSFADSAALNRSAPPNIALKNKRRRLPFVLIIILSLGIISVALYNYYERPIVTQTVDSKIKSIAVLPFKTIGEEGGSEKLGFGMAAAIINRLGRAKQIPVRPTSSIFQFTDTASADSTAVGRELGVDAILEGTIQHDGERVRVAVNLISVGNGQVLWAETFDEKSTNIFALQDSISNSVAKSLSINFTPPDKPAQQQPTPKAEAYQSYLLGIYFWNKRTKEDLQKAVWNFQQAIELDPNYAQAYAGLADCYNLLAYYGYSDSGEMSVKARQAAEKALALNDSLAEAHIAVAFVQGHGDEARRSLERAIELAPYNATARIRYGWNLLRDGSTETLARVEEQMRLAQEYDPLSHVSNGALCGVLMYRRNFDEAVKYCEKSYELLPNSTQTRLALADALFFKGRHDDAIATLKTEIENGRNPDYALGTLGYYYARLDRRDEAEKIFSELKPKAEKDARLLLDLILIGYALGKREESIEYFKQAYAKKALPPLMSYDPIWEQVGQDPEVKKIMEQRYKMET